MEEKVIKLSEEVKDLENKLGKSCAVLMIGI